MKTCETMCPFCGKIFVKKRENHVYCSNKCKYLHNHLSIAVHEDRICKCCGKNFVSVNAKQFFCSRKCQTTFNSDRKPDLMRRGNVFSTEKAHIDRVNAKTSRFEYISDWDGKYAYFICKDCGMIFKHGVGFTKPSKNNSIKCPNCSLILEEIKEKERLQKRELLKQKKLEEKRRIESAKPIKQATFQTCSICGCIFFSERKSKYCSKRCRTALQWKTAELYRYKVPLDKLYERDKGICHICGKKCDWDDKYTNENGFIVYGAYYPSRDHVIPKSKGGSHTWDNIKLAHIKCNSEKGAKYDTEEKRRIKEEVC